MPRHYSDQAQVTYDATTDFSNEEWKLLQEWQKELYSNVMNEIRQALISLGPLIATTVLSLISKEKDHLIPLNNTDSDRRSNTYHSANDVINNPDVFPRLTEEENQYLKNIPGTEHSQKSDCHNTDDVINNPDVFPRLTEEENQYLKNIPGTKRIQNNDCHNTDDVISNPDVFPKLTEEENQYLKNIPGTKRSQNNDCQNTACTTGIQLANTDCMIKVEEPISLLIDHLGEEVQGSSCDSRLGHEVISFCIKGEEESCYMEHQERKRRDAINNFTSNRSINRQTNTSSCTEFNDKSPMCTPATKMFKGDVTQNIYERSNSVNQMWPAGDQQLPVEEASIQDDSTLKYDNIIQFQSNPPKNHRGGHQPAQRKKEKYVCNVCGKSFAKMSKIIAHERIHTGERPFHCTVCGKSFNQKGILYRHFQMHTGEKPFQCNECGKQFTRNYQLLGHQKVHTTAPQD